MRRRKRKDADNFILKDNGAPKQVYRLHVPSWDLSRWKETHFKATERKGGMDHGALASGTKSFAKSID